MPFLSSMDNLGLLQDAYIILRLRTKHANFWLGVQYPLNHFTVIFWQKMESDIHFCTASYFPAQIVIELLCNIILLR